MTGGITWVCRVCGALFDDRGDELDRLCPDCRRAKAQLAVDKPLIPTPAPVAGDNHPGPARDDTAVAVGRPGDLGDALAPAARCRADRPDALRAVGPSPRQGVSRAERAALLEAL